MHSDELIDENSAETKATSPPPVSDGMVAWRKSGNRWENLELTDMLYGEPGDKLLSQAERLIFKFGSSYRLAKLVRAATGRRMTDALVQKWTYPKSRGGTGGVIPTRAWPFIFEAAEYAGVVLEVSDFDPRPKKVDLSKMIGPQDAVVSRKKKVPTF